MTLIQILEDVERYGAQPYDKDKFAALAQQCPRAYEYNVAIQNVLENYTTDIAEGMVRYGIHNGFDAWRRLFHHYVPLADDLQQLFIQELFELKPVDEHNVDKLFNDIQRISEWYIKNGTEALAEKAVSSGRKKRNFPIKLSIELSMGLRKFNIVDEIHNVFNIDRHDHRTGLPRGVPGIMIAMAEQATDTEPANSNNATITTTTIALGVVTTEDNSSCKHTSTTNNNEGIASTGQDFHAVPKGGKAKSGKRYGQCWECGEWGTPTEGVSKVHRTHGRKRR